MKDEKTFSGSDNRLLMLLRRVYNKISEVKAKPLPSDYIYSILGGEAGNQFISDSIKNQKPFLAARIGSTELSAVVNYLEIRELASLNPLSRSFKIVKGYDPAWSPSIKHSMEFFSGFFPSSDFNMNRFSKEFISHLEQVDLLAVWYNFGEDKVANTYCKNAKFAELHSLEPYFYDAPWSQYLEGKRVLVIHPFAKSIQTQFNRRASLFTNSKTLPDFDLQVIPAVQTMAGSRVVFANWFDALSSMVAKIEKNNFDVAIIGAGAYGLPLGSIIKQMGKQAIHLGGATQILFGIKGQRWDHHPVISSLYNEYWIRPASDEHPPDFLKVENGCYW